MRGKANLSEILRQARLLRGLKQYELARQTGLQPSAISQFETGQREPSLDNLRKLADALGVTADFLLARESLALRGPQLEKVIQHASRMSQKQLDELERFAAFISRQRSGLSRPGPRLPPNGLRSHSKN